MDANHKRETVKTFAPEAMATVAARMVHEIWADDRLMDVRPPIGHEVVAEVETTVRYRFRPKGTK